MAIRAIAERNKDGFQVMLLDFDDESGESSILDIATGESLVVVVDYLLDTHDLRNETILVENCEGGWEAPDCITLAEALECPQ